LVKLEANLLNKMPLRGIEGISKVFMREGERPQFNQEAGTYGPPRKEWVLDTEGCRLQEVMSDKEVDFRNTRSNYIPEILSILGIEAARNALLQELRNVIEYDGSYVNYRHLAMLTDVMTFRGHLMAITRHGINRVDTGPLMRCSFEESVEILLDAAVFAECDNMRGVSENIMMGALAPAGTGSFRLFLNDSMIKQFAVAEDFLDDRPNEIGGATPRQGTPMQQFGDGSSPSRSPDTGSPMQYGMEFSPSSSPFSPSSPASYGSASPYYGIQHNRPMTTDPRDAENPDVHFYERETDNISSIYLLMAWNTHAFRKNT
jgi:DNA-directed RNA polymerase II subunit RPB1